MAEFSVQDIALLTSEGVQGFLKEALQKKLDTLKAAEKLAKLYSNEERKTILDYYTILPKIFERFCTNDFKSIADFAKNPRFLICDTLAYEQSTASDLGIFKKTLWANCEGKVDDLCSGMGGDSMFLPAHLKVRGVDLDEARIAMFKANAKALGIERSTILADVRTVETDAEYFTIDPARRAAVGENQRDLRNLTPTLEEVVELSKKYKGGMAKLPPGYPINDIPKETEILYLGSRSDCRECLVLFGELAKNKDNVRAVMVDKTGNVIAEWNAPRAERDFESEERIQQMLEENDSLEGCDRTYRTSASYMDLPLGEVSAYLSEPSAILLRSHLFGEVAKQSDANAHLISEGIAYVSCNSPLPSPGFATFKIMDKCEIASGAVRNMLHEHGIGKLTLKLRGVRLDPDAEIKRLKPKGKNEAILFYTRVKGEKTAILAERVLA